MKAHAGGHAAHPAVKTPPPPSGLNSNVLVLNRLYHPIHVTSARRAFVLLYKNDAEAIALSNERIVGFDFSAWMEFSIPAGDGASLIVPGAPGSVTQPAAAAPAAEDDDFVATVSARVRVPRIVRLLEYERFPVGRVNFSRRNVLARDEYRCQYCSHRGAGKELTLDHVLPRSRGGKHCWTNVVTACYRCNDRKGRLTPREANMHLLRDPVAPKRSPEIKRKLEERKYTIWRLFLGA